MRILTCACGKKFFAKSSGHKYCLFCKDKKYKEVNSVWKKAHRKGVYNIKMCKICGKEFNFYLNQKYCKECFDNKEKERSKKRLKTDKLKKYWHDRYMQNPEKFKDYQKIYAKNNKIEIASRQKKWRSKNWDKKRELEHKRRALILKTKTGKISFKSIYEQNPYCFYCSKPLKIKEVHFDHFIPLSRGGLHIKQNIRVSCKTCNLKKHAKLPKNLFGMEV